MRYNRRKALTILGAATAATVLIQAAPSRAGFVPTLGVSQDPDENGRIRASASTTSPIKRIVARILTGPEGELIREVTDFVFEPLDSPAGYINLWCLSRDPLNLPDFGVFWIEWAVEDQEGLIGKGWNWLHYMRMPVLTITVAPTVVDQHHRTVTVTGTIVWRHPATKEEHVLADHPITVQQNGFGAPKVMVSSDADGRFSAQIPVETGGYVEAYTFENPSRGTGWGSSGFVDVEQRKTATRLTTTLNPASVKLGQPVALTGSLEQFLNDAWVPLPAYTVEVRLDPHIPGSGSSYYAALTTDSAGKFQAQFVPEDFMYGSAVFNYYYPYTDNYFTDASSDLVVRILQQMSFKGAPVAQLKSGNPHSPIWSVAAYVDSSVPAADQRSVEFQISEDGKTGWKELASTTVAHHTQWGERFLADVNVENGGFLRAFSPQNEFTLAAASAAIHLPPPIARMEEPTAGSTLPLPREIKTEPLA